MPNFNARFLAEQWPQDGVWTPPGRGQMPSVQRLNQVQTIREAYALPGKAVVTDGQIRVVQSNVGDDGDFWATHIILSVYASVGGVIGVNINQANWLKVQLTDIRSGYEMFYPYIRASELQIGRPAPGNVNQNIPLQVAIPQPYCFTRTGSAQWTFDNSPAGFGEVTIFYQLTGWKEYLNVSK